MTHTAPRVTGRAFLEAPRWRDEDDGGAFYVSDMFTNVVLRISESGDVSTVTDIDQPTVRC